MPISAPPPSWASIKNKPNTMSGFGITDGVQSLNGQSGAVTNTSLYAIGSVVTGRPQNYTNYAVDSTIAGSSLYQCSPKGQYYVGAWGNGVFGSGAGQSLVNTGTWRCVSGAYGDGANGGVTGTWVRIS